MASGAITYERHRPEATTLYQVVQENLETLYGAVDEGAVKVALPRFVRDLRRRGLLDEARDAEDTESDSEASGLAGWPRRRRAG